MTLLRCRVAVLLLLVGVLLPACRQPPPRPTTVGRHIDEVAEALGIARSEADDIVSQAARRGQIDQVAAANTIIDEADNIRPVESRMSATVDDFVARVGAARPTADEVIASAYCGLVFDALSGDLPSSREGRLDHAILIVLEQYPKEWADALWQTGWIDYVVDAVTALEQGDPDGVALVAAEAVYCSS